MNLSLPSLIGISSLTCLPLIVSLRNVSQTEIIAEDVNWGALKTTSVMPKDDSSEEFKAKLRHVEVPEPETVQPAKAVKVEESVSTCVLRSLCPRCLLSSLSVCLSGLCLHGNCLFSQPFEPISLPDFEKSKFDQGDRPDREKAQTSAVETAEDKGKYTWEKAPKVSDKDESSLQILKGEVKLPVLCTCVLPVYCLYITCVVLVHYL